jgi:DNA polymerase elongation subunit (family B)
MIVHNTDSVFFTFNLQDPTTGELIKDKKALEITIEIAQDAAKLCSKWLKTPMELSYEKTLMPFILLSKKRYVGMLYEFSAELSKAKLKFMGLSIKRKDSCDYLKDIYGQILNILMKEQNLGKAVEFLKDSLEQLIVGNVPMEKLIITKALKSDYKNPQQIAHRVLADRIAKRDEGNAPKSGDRMRFIHFVQENTQSNLQGDKIETPEFIIENNLKIDYTFYITNQLMKPLQQLFALSIIDIWKLNNKTLNIRKINQYNTEIEQMKKKYIDFEEFMKKKEKLSCDKVNELLFEPILKKIYNKNNNIQTMDRFVIRK